MSLSDLIPKNGTNGAISLNPKIDTIVPTSSRHYQLPNESEWGKSKGPSFVDDPRYHSNKQWDEYKATNPKTAGILGGAGNFVANPILGVRNAAQHPINTAEGIYNLSVALKSPGSKQNLQLIVTMAQTYDEFKSGDKYTQYSMGTEGVLTIASFL